MRVALTTKDFAKAVAFYRDGLGLGAGDLWTAHGRAQILGAGRATLEVFDEQQAQSVDQKKWAGV